MKSPWYCPYCEQTSTRKWNLSTHIQRKHRGLYNPIPDMKQVTVFPIPEMKQVTVFDSYSFQQKPESSNSFLPQFDMYDPMQIFEKSTKFQNLLQEIKQLSKIEINFLLLAIYNLPNYRNYSNRLF